MKKHHLLYWTLIIILIIANCASNKKTVVPAPVSYIDLPYIPAGVDSSLAQQARNKASSLFSTYEAKTEADTIYKNMIDYVKIVKELYEKLQAKKDSLKKLRSKAMNIEKEIKSKKSKYLEEQHKLKIITQKVAKDSATIEIVVSLLEYYLFDARSKLEHAYSIDPFNLRILKLSGLSENNRGIMYADTSAFYNALKYFFRYLEHDKGNYSTYSAIAASYYQLKNWEKAYEFARKAKEIYAITAYFDKPLKDTPIEYAETALPPYADPKEYFELLLTKGVTEIWSFRPDSALATLTQAIQLARTEKDKNYIKKQLLENYIFWDNKNIKTAQKHLEIVDSLAVRNYKWAYNALMELLPKLSSQKARHLVTWEIARLENDHFEKPEKAVERLYTVVAELDTNKETSTFFEAPKDTNKQKYFVDCGQILYRLGQKYREIGDVKKANKFLAQDTTIDWKGRARAFLIMVPELPDNIRGKERQKLAFKKRLAFLSRAERLKENLEKNEINMMYKQIIKIYRTLNMKKAKYYFNKWRQFQSQSNKSN